MSKVPEGYILENSVDRSILESEGYEHWTVQDLVDFCLDGGNKLDEIRLWIARYPEDDNDGDIYIRPVETFTVSSTDLVL